MSLTVEPATAEVSPDASESFSANVAGTFDGRVQWSVVRGPGSIHATTGVYTAPDRVPRDRDNDIVVRATSVVDPTRFAEATVRVVDWPFTPTRGPTEGGTIVTITGSGFTGQTQVFFDGIAGTDLVVESNVLLKVTTPPRALIGAAEVRIETPGQEPRIFPNGFKYAATRLRLGGGTLIRGCRYTRDVKAFDVNRDGALDLVGTCYYDAKLAIYLNDGLGGLSNPVFLPTGATYPRSLALGDFDGDGDDDLFVSTSYSVKVFRHDADGSLVPVASHTIDPNAYGPRIIAKDLTGDGKADLAYPGYDRLVVVKNDGVGGFLAAATVLAPANVDYLYDISAAPVRNDADADVDIAVSYDYDLNSPVGGVLVFVNSGLNTGNFAAPVVYPFKDYTGSVRLADLNGDGFTDMVAGNDSYDGADLGIRMGTAAGFGAPAYYPTTYVDPATGNTYTASMNYGYLDVTDVDMDGSLDVVSAWSSFARVWYGNGTGAVAAPTRYDVTQYAYTTPLAVNLDGTATKELVSVGYELVEMQLSQANRNYGPPRVGIGTNPEFIDLRWPLGGAPEVVVPVNNGAAGAAIQVLDATQLLTIAPAVQGPYALPANSVASRLRVEDLDKDGVGDAIATDPGTYTANDGSVWILPGLAAGGLGVALQEPFDQSVTDARTTDLDGDSWPDLIVATSDPTTNLGDLRVRWGDSAPFVFGDDVIVPSGGKPYRLELADLDEDGREELIATDNVAGRVAIVSVTTDRVFGEPVYIPVGDSPTELIVDDVNLDYIPDLIVLSRYGTTGLLEIDVIKGLGDLQFDLPERYRFSGTAYSLAFEDVDGDGMKDIALTTTNPAAVVVLRGHDGGRFREPEYAPVGGTPYGLSLVDFDGNGLKDAIVSDRYGAAIRPLSNTSR